MMCASPLFGGLGQTAPNPVLSTIRYFRHEYEEHILDKRCSTGACRELTTFHMTRRSARDVPHAHSSAL